MDPNNGAVTSSQPQISGTSPISLSPKINWIISVVFLILGILIGAFGFWVYQNYLVKKTPVSTESSLTSTPLPTEAPAKEGNPTANWKTYSRIVNFTFQFPNDWSEQPNYSLQSSNKLMTIWIEGETVGLECLTLIKTENKTIKNTNLVLKYYDGMKSENCDTQGKKIIFFLFTVSSKKYSFTFDYKDSNKEESEKLFIQILSTFKFTK